MTARAAEYCGPIDINMAITRCVLGGYAFGICMFAVAWLINRKLG